MHHTPTARSIWLALPGQDRKAYCGPISSRNQETISALVMSSVPYNILREIISRCSTLNGPRRYLLPIPSCMVRVYTEPVLPDPGFGHELLEPEVTSAGLLLMVCMWLLQRPKGELIDDLSTIWARVVHDCGIISTYNSYSYSSFALNTESSGVLSSQHIVVKY